MCRRTSAAALSPRAGRPAGVVIVWVIAVCGCLGCSAPALEGLRCYESGIIPFRDAATQSPYATPDGVAAGRAVNDGYVVRHGDGVKVASSTPRAHLWCCR